MDIKLKCGTVFKIDFEDYVRLSEWTFYYDTSNGYVKAIKGKERNYLHRLVAGSRRGDITDHINRDKLDNRKNNLRIVDANLNNYNREIKGERGIWFDNWGKRWRSSISFNNKTIKLGSFKTKRDAAEAYNEMAREIYGNDAFQHDLKKI